MTRKLSTLIANSDLSPKERILLVIENSVHKYKTGESIFDEHEIWTLTQQWRPESDVDIRTYNKYVNFWVAFQKLHRNMAAEFLSAQLSCANLEKILTIYFYNQDIHELEKLLQQRVVDLSDKDPFLYILENTGLSYDALIHTHTFQSLPKDVQNDLCLIDPYASDDYWYFNQEEKLTEILDGKDELAKEEINKLAKVIIDSFSWEKEEHHDVRIFMYRIFGRSFGSLPLSYIAEQIADKYEIEYEDEDELYEELYKLPNLKNKARSVLKKEIQDGIFNHYSPLCNCEGTTTHEGETTRPLKEVWKIWIDAKRKVEAEIEEKIISGQYVVEERELGRGRCNLKRKIITGIGLYYGDESLLYVREYKEQVDQLKIYGYLFKEIAGSDIKENYAHLLKFRELAERVSLVVDQDVVELAERPLKDNRDAINTINLYIGAIASQVDRIHEDLRCEHPISSALGSFIFDLDSIEPRGYEITDDFESEASISARRDWEATKQLTK